MAFANREYVLQIYYLKKDAYKKRKIALIYLLVYVWNCLLARERERERERERCRSNFYKLPSFFKAKWRYSE